MIERNVKRQRILLPFMVFLFVFFYYLTNNAMAADVSLSVNNTSTILELSVPSSVDLRLTPTRGSAFNTANLNIGVGTNNSTGYSLSMTATSTDLTRTASITDGNNNTSTPTIPTISTAYSQSSFESSNDTINKWGFKLSTTSNYGPMVTTTQTLKTTEGPSNATGSDVILNFAAKVDTTQPAGIYQTTLNFTIISNIPATTSIAQLSHLQDFANLSENEKFYVVNSMADDRNYTLTDRRDMNSYTIRKINGQVWMTQNLRITGVISSQYSNFTGDDYNVSEYDLTDGVNCTSEAASADNPKGYNNACSHDSGNVTQGVWYNYAAASAGTVIGYVNRAAATSDICPSGWHLPSGPSTTEGTDLSKLVGNTTGNWQAATDGLIAFGAVSGGHYRNGTFYSATYGNWWSADFYNNTYRFFIRYNSNNNQFYGNGSTLRPDGFFVRCVLK